MIFFQTGRKCYQNRNFSNNGTLTGTSRALVRPNIAIPSAYFTDGSYWNHDPGISSRKHLFICKRNLNC